MKNNFRSFLSTKRGKLTAVLVILVLSVCAVGTTAAATVLFSGNISAARAEQIALGHAGADKEDVTLLRVWTDIDDGVTVYEVEFYWQNNEYDYEINAADGSIRDYDVDPVNGAFSSTTAEHPGVPQTLAPVVQAPAVESTQQAPEAPSQAEPASVPAVQPSKPATQDTATVPNTPETSRQPSENIGNDAALNIALNHAGLNAAQVTVIKNKLDIDDGVYEYDIEFVTDTKEYEYEINASTGAVTSIDTEYIRIPSTQAVPETAAPAAQPETAATTTQASTVNPAPQSTAAATATADFIGNDAALGIALNHAGLSANDVTVVKNRLDLDDGVYEYEIEFVKGMQKHEYEINAASGAVTDWDRDSIFD